MDVDELRGLALFDGTDDEQLGNLLAASTPVAFRPGEELFRAGEQIADWWALLEGRIDLVRKTRHEDLVIRSMDVPGQWIGAVGAWDPQAVYVPSGRASSEGRILRAPVHALRAVSSTRFPLGDHILEGLVTTLSSAPRAWVGTGLGLGIARRIVDRHGGEIGVESRPGATLLRVHLPPEGHGRAGPEPAAPSPR